MTRTKIYPRRRCQAAVYHRDCYRVDRRACVPGRFSMHYTKDQCKRPTAHSLGEFCWQHGKMAYPEIADYFRYMDARFHGDTTKP